MESLEALIYLVKGNALRTLFYCGVVPFGIAWVHHNSPSTAFALQAYCVTALVFVDDPFRTEKQSVKKWWFWKVMLSGGALVHPFLLAAIWQLDATHPALVTGGIGVFSVAIVAGALEIVILGLIVDHYRPSNHLDPA